MATGNTSIASAAADLTNAIDWVDIFYNAEILMESTGVEELPESSIPECSSSLPQEQNNVTPSPSSDEESQADVDQLPESTGPIPKIAPEVAVTHVLPTDAKAQVRSERKRTREKQRRLDVNSQIVDLTAVLQKVEGEDKPEGDVTTASPGNRVDLIARTLSLLSRIHNENGKRQREITDLQGKVKVAKKNVEEKKLKEQQEAVVAAQQTSAMMMPMMNGGFMQMQPMMFQPPSACFANGLPSMYCPPMQPKILGDASKPQSMLQAQPTFMTAYQPNSTIPYQQQQHTFVNSNVVGGNLAHCA